MEINKFRRADSFTVLYKKARIIMVMYESSLEVMSETRWNEYVDEVQLALLKKN
jgi:hypothetical protein